MVWRAGVRTLAVAGLALVAAAVAERVHPRAPRRLDVDSIVIGGQLDRTETLPRADVILLGDSSCLMGVNAAALEERLGGRTAQSLCTVAWVGPTGYGRMLERYHHAIGGGSYDIVLLFNRVLLSSTDDDFKGVDFERWVLEGTRERPASPPVAFFRDARRVVFEQGIGSVVEFPLPGIWGRRYSSREAMASALVADHGGLVDPHVYTPTRSRSFQYTITSAVKRRLTELGKSLVAVKPRRVRVGLTPVPEGEAAPDLAATRDQVLTEIRDGLGLGAQDALNLPLTLPDELFASHTHPSAAGRARLTEALAAELTRTP